MTARRLGLAAVAVAVAAVLAGCTPAAPDPGESPAPEARPVTTEEAQLLAVARFGNFDAGTRPFSTAVREEGVDVALQGWIDYASHVGYAAVTGGFDPQALVWDDEVIGLISATADDDGDPPLPMPPASDPWSVRELDAETSRLDALLTVLSSLGSDRPDNPLLVQQTGAMWLRTDAVGDTPVTVFAAPPDEEPGGESAAPITADTSPLRLWVDERGLIRRVEVRLGDTWATADMPDASGPALGMPEGAAP